MDKKSALRKVLMSGWTSTYWVPVANQLLAPESSVQTGNRQMQQPRTKYELRQQNICSGESTDLSVYDSLFLVDDLEEPVVNPNCRSCRRRPACSRRSLAH